MWLEAVSSHIKYGYNNIHGGGERTAGTSQGLVSTNNLHGDNPCHHTPCCPASS
jgi:hypothetical protein